MNYYFDMDGVITVYEKWAFRGENPIFMKLGSHYFRTCKPDYKMIETIEVLNQCSNVYILTSVSNGFEISKEQVDDKISWLSKYCPFINIPKQFISVNDDTSKSKYVSSKEDILIDDYNINLLEWKNAGGIAVKYLNGVNSYNSFKSEYVVSKDMSVDEIVNCLKSIGNFVKYTK